MFTLLQYKIARVRKARLAICIGLTIFAVNTSYCQYYTISTIAGTGGAAFSSDGIPATASILNYPLSIIADDSGNVYFTDWGNSRIRKINTAGIISTIAGNGMFTYSGDGGPAKLSGLRGPSGICRDAAGNIYITDVANERVRKIDTHGNISTIAGNGQYGYAGDGGLAINASFKDPTGIGIDNKGNIYITDVFNNSVREITAGGIITTIAGNGIAGYSGDGGQAILAKLYYPTAIAIDDSNNVYISDEDNNCIRKIDASSVITTIAGNGTPGYLGDGGPATAAELNFPEGLIVDSSHNLYITDATNNVIRMVNTRGVIYTIAGNGAQGFSGDGGLATTAALYNPTGIVQDASGNLYVCDAFNFRIRKLTKHDRYFTNEDEGISLFPNPGYGIFNISVEYPRPGQQIEIFNLLGQKMYYSNLNTSGLTQIDLTHKSSGIYLYVVSDNSGKEISRGKIVLL